MTATVGEWVKHVSFDDLAPTMIDDRAQDLKGSKAHIGFNNGVLHVPPQFNPLYHSEGSSAAELSFNGQGSYGRSGGRSFDHGHGSSDERMEKMFAFALSPPKGPSASLGDAKFRSRSGSPLRTSWAPRLPPAPSTSSLKLVKKSVDEQGPITDYNVADMDFETERKMNRETMHNTQSNSGSSSGFTQSAFSNLNELEDRLDGKNKNAATLSKHATQDKRKKSFAGMSDEELAHLEDFYTSQSRSTASTPTVDSFDFKQQDPFFIDNVVKKNSSLPTDPLAAIYPTRPVVNHRALSMTLQHKDYDEYVEKFNIDTGSKKPEESLAALRVINCYISGRRYTWSATDWFVENMAQDGDHFVIVTSIPLFEREVEDSASSWKHRSATRSLRRMMSADSVTPEENDKELSHSISSTNESETLDSVEPLAKGARIQAIHEEAKKTCCRILKYYSSRLNGKIVKITVEMIKEEKTVDAITKAAALYKPDVQIVSTVSTNLQIKFRNGFVKLPFFLMRHYAMPTLIIPFEFIDPKSLGERTEIETTQAKAGVSSSSGEAKNEQPLSITGRIDLLDSIILKTLKNPFLPESKDGDAESDINAADNESVVGSVHDYFPISPKRKKDLDSFEKIGYVRPPLTRKNLYHIKDSYDSDGNRLQPTSTSASSRRSSRLQYDDGMYKVKSLIDDLEDHEMTGIDERSLSSPYYNGSSVIRKTKSMAPMSKSTTHSSTMSPPKSDSLRSNRFDLKKAKSQDPSPTLTPSKSSGSKPKKKKGFASFIKKVFK